MQNAPYGGSLFPGGQAPTAQPPPKFPALDYQIREMQDDPYYQLTQRLSQANLLPPVSQAPSWEENPYYWLVSGQQPPAPTPQVTPYTPYQIKQIMSSGQQPVAQAQQPAFDPADWRTWTNGG
jgi:hypothetical protein